MPPPGSRGRKPNPFDDQLAALRQRIALPPTLPNAEDDFRAPHNVSSTTSTTTNATSSLHLLYSGAFTAPAPPPRVPLSSSHAVVDGHTSNILETLRYLKRAARERMEEFADMGDQFTYDAEDEEAAFAMKQRLQHASAGRPLITEYRDPLHDPFTFEVVEESLAVHSTQQPPQLPPPHSTDDVAVVVQRELSKPKKRAFEASYDAATALYPTPQHTSPTLMTPAQLGTLELRSAPPSRLSHTSSSSTKPSTVFSSHIPSIGRGATQPTSVGSHSSLGTTGTVVAHSSVSVAAHVRQGAARLVTAEHVVTQSSPHHVVQRKHILRHRPSCTVEMVSPAGIRFCVHCGHCNVVDGLHCQTSCASCGVGFTSQVQADSTHAPEIDDVDALDRIEALEREEARAFQAAIAEWRLGGGNSDGSTTDDGSTAGTTTRPPEARQLIMPAGSTYFTCLWDQLPR